MVRSRSNTVSKCDDCHDALDADGNCCDYVEDAGAGCGGGFNVPMICVHDGQEYHATM